jgi:RNA polymerase sigma factor (sigma-70 family)
MKLELATFSVTHPGSDKDAKWNLSTLKQQLVAGNPIAIEQLYRQYFHRLLYYGRQAVSQASVEQVEDVIQEFFLWLSQHTHKLREVRNLEAYLFQSVRRNLYARLRKEQRSQQRQEELAAQLQQAAESPEKVQIQAEEGQTRRALVRRALSQLPASQREAIYLRYFEDKTYEEIAEILSVNHQVAYNYVSRGLKRLRLQLSVFVVVLVLGIGWLSLL